MHKGSTEGELSIWHKLWRVDDIYMWKDGRESFLSRGNSSKEKKAGNGGSRASLSQSLLPSSARMWGTQRAAISEPPWLPPNPNKMLACTPICRYILLINYKHSVLIS